MLLNDVLETNVDGIGKEMIPLNVVSVDQTCFRLFKCDARHGHGLRARQTISRALRPPSIHNVSDIQSLAIALTLKIVRAHAYRLNIECNFGSFSSALTFAQSTSTSRCE